MNSVIINRYQRGLTTELPWINGITTEKDYESALECLTMTTGKIEAQPFLIKIITDRISEYETARNESLVLKNDSSVNDNGLAALLTLMGHRKLKNLALVDVLGSTSLISQILNGKRALTVPHIYALAKFFNVKPSVFL